MLDESIECTGAQEITDRQIERFLRSMLGSSPLRRLLVIPPDATRAHSGAGKLTAMIWRLLKDSCQVDILPASGTHCPMSRTECEGFFGADIPWERYQVHRYRNDVVKIGSIPSCFTNEVSDGLYNDQISVEINRCIMNPTYDLICSIGQIVPHEVAGMSGFSKNILVGLGGADMINKSHMLGAVCGMEKAMGKDHSPVRRVFDYAQQKYLDRLPIRHILTVVEAGAGVYRMRGLYGGEGRSVFEKAVKMSQRVNITRIGTDVPQIVVYLDPREFQSTWLGNKAIYRTRMAIPDGGELIVIAPGVSRFGEDPRLDRLIRTYGYCGTERVLKLWQTCEDLQTDLAAAAHLIHGSTNGRFFVTYSPGGLSKGQIEGVGYRYLSVRDAQSRYPLDSLREGMNRMPDGRELYFISNPADGLWTGRDWSAKEA